jgi:anti-sigma regulatory factor (Ser/Thr protein kinase)
MASGLEEIDATPSKRLFLSIIADYDLKRSVCELIDNALDIWVRMSKKTPIKIQIDIDQEQHTICIIDNAGGIKRENLRFVISPGGTTNAPEEEVIGIFGVGTKRAVIALAQDVRITTRHGKEKTYRIQFDDEWLNLAEDWRLPLYEPSTIEEGTTRIDLQRLRIPINNDALTQLKEHLEATYANFLVNANVEITLNGKNLKPKKFENWAYPPSYEPRRYEKIIRTEDGKQVRMVVTAGLARESSPAGGEYGIYFYCNERLIARALKSYDVGFTKGLAGLPHPSISLVRVIVSLKGEADLMPWNSSKSGINANHHIFITIQKWLVQVVKEFASLSRRFEGEWPEKVFKYSDGEIQDVQQSDFLSAAKSYLPKLPKSNLRYGDKVKKANRKIAAQKPWVKGLYEGIIAVDLILNQKLTQRNRISLILIDSSLEIAFKEYLVNESSEFYSDSRISSIFEKRHLVIDEVKKVLKKNNVLIDDSIWKKINYYYGLRCKLVHERASVQISDDEIWDFRQISQKVLRKMYNLQFKLD